MMSHFDHFEMRFTGFLALFVRNWFSTIFPNRGCALYRKLRSIHHFKGLDKGCVLYTGASCTCEITVYDMNQIASIYRMSIIVGPGSHSIVCTLSYWIIINLSISGRSDELPTTSRLLLVCKTYLKTLLFQKEFVWIYEPSVHWLFFKALLDIMGVKGAILNINHYWCDVAPLKNISACVCFLAKCQDSPFTWKSDSSIWSFISLVRSKVLPPQGPARTFLNVPISLQITNRTCFT